MSDLLSSEDRVNKICKNAIQRLKEDDLVNYGRGLTKHLVEGCDII